MGTGRSGRRRAWTHRPRAAAAVAAAAVIVIAGLGACGNGTAPTDGDHAIRATAREHVEISAVTGDPTNGRRLALHVLGTPADLDDDDPCAERYEAEVVETEQEITVEVLRVQSADYTKGGCQNVDRTVEAELEGPAASRPVVDRGDGRRFTPTPDGAGYTAPAAPCGLEDLACQGKVPPTTAPAAACTTESYRYAVAAEIDGGHYPISNERCDGTWAAFDVDLGADACRPEADADDPCRGTRVHRTFWRNDDGRWRLLSYQGTGDCDEARAADPRFPPDVCRR